MLKARSSICCDDIRREANGNLILISVHPPLIGFEVDEEDEDCLLRLSFVIIADCDKPSEGIVAFRIIVDNDIDIVVRRMKIGFHQKISQIPIPIGPFFIPLHRNNRKLSLQIRQKDKWHTITDWELKVTN